MADALVHIEQLYRKALIKVITVFVSDEDVIRDIIWCLSERLIGEISLWFQYQAGWGFSQ